MEDKINSIIEIINSWDPIELFPMAPSDEYEYEIYEIYKYIHTNKCIQRKELAEYIYDLFIKSFGDDVFLLKQSDCLIIADEILNLNA